MAGKPKRYCAGRVNRYVKRVPVKGEKAYGATEEWHPHEYPIYVMMQKPKDIIALRTLEHNIANWDYMQTVLRKVGGLENIHELPIGSRQMFTEEGKNNLLKASRIAHSNVKKGRKTVVTCNKGYKRTSGFFYLLHRREGASHEEALKHSKLPNIEDPFSEKEKEHLEELYEERKKYGG